MPSMYEASKRSQRIPEKKFVATQRQCENCQQCAIALGVEKSYVAAKIMELCDAGFSKILRDYPDYTVELAKSHAKNRRAANLSSFAEVIPAEEANGENIVLDV